MNRRVMADASSNNGPINLRKHWKAGHRVLTLKATEGLGYTWDGHAGYVKAWHRKGGIVWHYHFMRPGSGTAQADLFWKAVSGHLGPHDRVVVDVEAEGVTAASVRAFIDRVHAHTNHAGIVYGPPYFLREHGVKPRHGWDLWVADYSGGVDLIPAGWKTWTAHQFTRNGRAAGFTGDVDLSHLKPRVLHPTLHRGERSFAVREAKKRLRYLGYHGFVINNSYGPGFARAVAKFKRDHHARSHTGLVWGGWMWRHTR